MALSRVLYNGNCFYSTYSAGYQLFTYITIFEPDMIFAFLDSECIARARNLVQIGVNNKLQLCVK